MNKKSSKTEGSGDGGGGGSGSGNEATNQTQQTTIGASEIPQAKNVKKSAKSSKQQTKATADVSSTQGESTKSSLSKTENSSNSTDASSSSSKNATTNPQSTNSNEQTLTQQVHVSINNHNNISTQLPLPPPQQLVSSTAQYYYPYIQAAGIPAHQGAYAPITPLDVNTAASWPQAMAAAAMAMASACGGGNPDPVAFQAYMNAASGGAYGPPPPEQYDQSFTLGFTPAFGFGYNANGQIDYVQSGQGLNTNAALWTPGAYVPNGSSGSPHNSPPLQNHKNSQNEQNTSSTSTSSNPGNNNDSYSNNKHQMQQHHHHQPQQQWIQLVPADGQHLNDLNAQQISPVYHPHHIQQQQHPLLGYRHHTHYNLHHHQHLNSYATADPSQFSRKAYNNEMRYNTTTTSAASLAPSTHSNNGTATATSSRMNGAAIQFYPFKHQQSNGAPAYYTNNMFEHDFNSMQLTENGAQINTNTNKYKTDRRITNNKYTNNSSSYGVSAKASQYNSGNKNSNKQNGEISKSNPSSNKNFRDDEEEEFNEHLNNDNTNLSKSDSKTWASIVGVGSTTSKTAAPPSGPTIATNTDTNPSSSSSPPLPIPSNLSNQDVDQEFNQNFYNRNYYNFNKSNNGNSSAPMNNFKPFKKYNSYRQSQNSVQSSQQEPQHVEFNLNNGAFPPISVNKNNSDSNDQSNKTVKDTNEEIETMSSSSKKENQDSNLSEKNVSYSSNNYYKKQQHYTTYPKSQPKQYDNAETTTTTGNASYFKKPFRENKHPNSSSTNSNNFNFKEGNQYNENDETNHYYYRRHQPSQPTLSSYITNIDKSILFENKNKNQENVSASATATNSPPGEMVADSNKTINSSNNTQMAGSYTRNTKSQNERHHINIQLQSININPSEYNPKDFNLAPKAARFYVIKSYSEEDVHRSIKYNIWCSTDHGNRRLDMAFAKSDGNAPVYLFFSVNGSGHFCGMAEMVSRVDYNRTTGVWSQDKWKGCLQVKWIYVKDVPNTLLRNIKLENNDMKPVTNSRDTQEIPYEKGKQVLKIFHNYNHTSSIFDDFELYDKKLDEDTNQKTTCNNHNTDQIESSSSSASSITSTSSMSISSKTKFRADSNLQNPSTNTTTTTNEETNETTTNNNNKNELNKNFSNDTSKLLQKTLTTSSCVTNSTSETNNDSSQKSANTVNLVPTITSGPASSSSSSSASSSTSSSAEESSKEDPILKNQAPKLVALSSS